MKSPDETVLSSSGVQTIWFPQSGHNVSFFGMNVAWVTVLSAPAIASLVHQSCGKARKRPFPDGASGRPGAETGLYPPLHMFIMGGRLCCGGDFCMAVCKKNKDGGDCDRNFHNRRIVEGCPENLADVGTKIPVYDPREAKNRCLSALGD